MSGSGPPPEIAGYRIKSRLGAGANGTVFLARQLALERDVALKVLTGSGESLLPTQWERFERECRLLVRHPHPCLVPVLDADLRASPPYLALGFLEGGDIAGRRFDPDAGVRVLRRVAEALAHLHRREVIHRDVKPENILLDADGEAFLGDLGLGAGEGFARLTATGYVVGTVAYMPPEIYEGGEVGAPGDVFAWGLVAGEVFGAPRAPAIPERRGEWGMGLERAVPGRLLGLVRRCLRTAPGDRPRAEELAATLRRIEAETRPLAGAGAGDGRTVSAVVKLPARRRPEPRPGSRPAPAAAPWPRWVAPLFLVALAGATWWRGRAGGAPAAVRWRVVGDRAVVTLDAGAPAGTTLERDGVAVARLDRGATRLVAGGLDRSPRTHRLVWPGGAGPEVTLTADPAAVAGPPALAPGGALRVTVRRPVEAAWGDAALAPWGPGPSRVAAPPLRGPGLRLRWREDAVDFAASWRWQAVVEAGLARYPDAASYSASRPAEAAALLLDLDETWRDWAPRVLAASGGVSRETRARLLAARDLWYPATLTARRHAGRPPVPRATGTRPVRPPPLGGRDAVKVSEPRPPLAGTAFPRPAERASGRSDGGWELGTGTMFASKTTWISARFEKVVPRLTYRWPAPPPGTPAGWVDVRILAELHEFQVLRLGYEVAGVPVALAFCRPDLRSQRVKDRDWLELRRRLPADLAPRPGAAVVLAMDDRLLPATEVCRIGDLSVTWGSD